MNGRDDIIQRLERDLRAKEQLYVELEEKLGIKDQAYKSVVESKQGFHAKNYSMLQF